MPKSLPIMDVIGKHELDRQESIIDETDFCSPDENESKYGTSCSNFSFFWDVCQLKSLKYLV